MLQNPYYVGIVRYAGVEYEGSHEHLIDERTFAQAKTVLTAHANSSEKDRKHHHYLKGSLYCGRCGSRMSLTYAKETAGAIPTSSASGAPEAPAASSPMCPST